MAAQINNRERNVLIIGNNNELLKLLAVNVNKQSSLYDVTIILTSHFIADYLKSKNFDVIVYDYDTDNNNGDNLITQFHRQRPSIPIIVITDIDYPEHALKLLNLGASDFITKHAEFYRFLPRIITTNIQRSLLIESLQESLNRIEQTSKDESILNKFIVQIHSSLVYDEILDNLSRLLQEEFIASRVMICLKQENRSNIPISYKFQKQKLKSIREQSLIITRYLDMLLASQDNDPLVVLFDDSFDYANEIKLEMKYYDINSLVMVPFNYRGKLMGFLYLDHVDMIKYWNQSELFLLKRIANQLAIALSQAKLYQIVEAHSKTVDKLSALCNELTSVVSSTKSLTQQNDSLKENYVHFSKKEIEILRGVAKGYSNKQISESMNTTIGTCEVRISKLKRKLNLETRAALVKYAFENHLL